MRSALIGVLAGLVLGLGAASAAEQVEIKPPKPTRAERTKTVKEQIAHNEAVIQRNNDAEIARREKKSAQQAKFARLLRQEAEGKLKLLRRELDWLEGRLSLASAEQTVKDLEATMAKAKDPEKVSIETALAAARAEVEVIKKWEAGTAP